MNLTGVNLNGENPIAVDANNNLMVNVTSLNGATAGVPVDTNGNISVNLADVKGSGVYTDGVNALGVNLVGYNGAGGVGVGNGALSVNIADVAGTTVTNPLPVTAVVTTSPLAVNIS